MRRFVADLHLHTVLSPCAAVEMTPRNLVWHAAELGLDIIAITDHNAGDNVIAALEAAKGTDLVVLPGMEVETKEEIHILTLFDKMRNFRAWEAEVRSHMSGLKNNDEKLGAQFIVDAEDNLVAVKEEMLLAPLRLGLDEVCDTVAVLGGMCIASHVDRPAYSILYKLGFIPPGTKLAAAELSRRTSKEEALTRFPVLAGMPLVTASDAHTIDDFVEGPKTVFYMDHPNLAEIRQALYRENSREVMF